MRNNLLDRLSKSLRYLLLSGGIFYLVTYIIIVVIRIQYPFALEWQEGASVDHVIRILSGHKYYIRPSLEFVPSIYTPLYFYVSAAVAGITGVGFMPLRLVSFISSLGSFFVIFLIVRRETGSIFSGVLAACLFIATFELSGSWLDLARVDSLFLFLLLTGIYLVRFAASKKSYFFAAILISLSFMTKQTALIISLPVMLYCILTDKRSVFSFIVPVIIIIGAGSFLLNYIHDGWFNFYVFELPKTTPIDERPLMHFLVKDIYLPLIIVFFIAAFYLMTQMINWNKKNFLFYFLTVSGMLGASLYSRYRGGGYYNVLLPAYAGMSILFGLGVNKLLEICGSFNTENGNLMKVFIYLICIAQFSFSSLIYNPFEQVPSKGSVEAGKKFIDRISQIKGDIFMPDHGYYSALAGKKSFANQMGMRDVITTSGKNHKSIKAEFIDELKQAMKEKKFAAIIISSFEPWYPHDMEKYYKKEEKIFDDATVLLPVTGMETRPEYIYVPR